MLGRRPGGEIGPARRDQFQCQRRAQTVNLGQIDTDDALERRAHVAG